MKRLVVGNWKMHETSEQAASLARAIATSLAHATIDPGVAIAIAPPFTALEAVRRALAGEPRIALGAQNMHWENAGAFTGEISAPMLVDFGVRYVILGHSERRRGGESDGDVHRKVLAALEHGLTPVVAVGETGQERDAGLAHERVAAQTRAAFDAIDRTRLREVVIAYEPVWAIGSGRNCDPSEADRVMATIRSCMPGFDDVPILYGGSVKPENFAAYLAQHNCNGGLIGGASLDPQAFISLVRLVLEAARA